MRPDESVTLPKIAVTINANPRDEKRPKLNERVLVQAYEGFFGEGSSSFRTGMIV
jgi:hypothetical protein